MKFVELKQHRGRSTRVRADLIARIEESSPFVSQRIHTVLFLTDGSCVETIEHVAVVADKVEAALREVAS